MPKTFISGMAGFIGSWIAEEFTKMKWDVVGVDNLGGGYLSNVPNGATFVRGDCCDLELMKKLTAKCDVVYHCAASPHEGLSVFSPAIIARNVYLSTATLLSACISNRVRRFVLCSSMARYGRNKVPFTEDMPTKPCDPYGASKVSSEELVKVLADAHGFEYVIAAPHNIYGPRQKYNDPYRNVIGIFINLMLQGRQPYIYGDGNQRRSFSYIEDVIPILVQLAIRDDVVGEVFNVGPDEEFVTINEVASIIARNLGFDLKPIYLPPRLMEVQLAACSAKKIRSRLGFKTKWSLELGIARTVEWIRKEGPKPFDYYLNLEIVNENTPATWRDKLL